MRSHFFSTLRVLLGFVAATAFIAACGAASEAPPNVKTGGGEPDASGPPGDDAGADGPDNVTATAPSLVLVNGLIGGGKYGYDDIRVCLDGADYPLPDALPMPMTSYPGVARGTGVDLGASNTMTLRVFRAFDLEGDSASLGSRIPCASWVAKTSISKTSIPVVLSGPTLVVLVDDPTGPDGIQARTGALPAAYKGTKDSLQLVTAEFSTFARKGGSLRVTVDDRPAGAGLTGVLSSDAYAFTTAPGFVDGAKLRFVRTDLSNVDTASFTQTLGSVQFLSDPTTTPAPFFARRANFALVLLGDENLPVALDGRDLHFDGRGLHAVAVPYAAVAQ